MRKNTRIAQTAIELKQFLDETIRKSEFTIEKIKFTEQSNWSIMNGVLSHVSNGFFQVSGLKSKLGTEEYLVLFQPQSALTGLALFKDGDKVYILLQARIEPGNSNIGQFGPTIQSTPANYLQMHGGKKTSYVELFNGFSPNCNPIGNCMQLDLGQRYYQKSKLHSYVECKGFLETEPSMIWTPLNLIYEMLSFDNFFNADLRSLISVFDWDLFVQTNHSGKSIENTRTDDLLFFSESQLGKSIWELVPLEQLKGWEIRDEGIVDISNSGVSVEMYKVACRTREVSNWSQPLMSASNMGLVMLLFRKVHNSFECLITIENEPGVSGHVTILPSLVRYAGNGIGTVNLDQVNGVEIARIIQSEEGGRFYKNESLYRVVLIDNEIEIESNQRWISVGHLKVVLKSSNKASFQLRCISSLLLEFLNPISCKT